MTNIPATGGVKQNHPEGCRCTLCQGACSWCGTRWHGGWVVVRILILLILIAGVFAMGVKVGEFKAAFGSAWNGRPYGHDMMRGFGEYGSYGRGYGMPGRDMMNQWYPSGGYNNQIPAIPPASNPSDAQLPQ